MIKGILERVTVAKALCGLFLSAVAVVGVLFAWNTGIKSFVAKFETVAHASAEFKAVREDLQVIGKEFQVFSWENQLRRYRDELYALRDQYRTSDPLQIPDQIDRDRYRFLQEEIKKLEKDKVDLESEI